jgi:hypothetical protein
VFVCLFVCVYVKLTVRNAGMHGHQYLCHVGRALHAKRHRQIVFDAELRRDLAS